MSVETGSPLILTPSMGVRIRSYVAHTDGLKEAGVIRTGECRHYSSMVGITTGLKLIGPDPSNYRDWVLEGLFKMTHVATGERTRAARMYNRDRRFFRSVKGLLTTGKAVEFSYEFYVERLRSLSGLKKRLEITSLETCENSFMNWISRR
jgi:hypothetical protein